VKPNLTDQQVIKWTSIHRPAVSLSPVSTIELVHMAQELCYFRPHQRHVVLYPTFNTNTVAQARTWDLGTTLAQVYDYEKQDTRPGKISKYQHDNITAEC
jgi:hypothetical protein